MRVAISLALLLLWSAPATAQNARAAATAQFDQGRAMMKAGKFKEACDAFEKSQQLDPQNGTLFNLAGCHTAIGKLATAWLAYRDLAQRDTNAKRKAEASKRAKELDKRIPKLVLVAPAKQPTGFTVTLDGVDAGPLVGIDNPIDLGEHKIVATAPGHKPLETVAKVALEGKTVTVKLDLETLDAVTAKRITPAPREVEKPIVEQQPRSHRRRNGAIATALGGVAVAGGIVFGLKAKGNWDDAEALCPEKQCPTNEAKVEGDSLTQDARGAATISTVLFVGGAAVTALGLYFVITGKPSSSATALKLVPSADGAAVVFGGRF